MEDSEKLRDPEPDRRKEEKRKRKEGCVRSLWGARCANSNSFDRIKTRRLLIIIISQCSICYFAVAGIANLHSFINIHFLTHS